MREKLPVIGETEMAINSTQAREEQEAPSGRLSSVTSALHLLKALSEGEDELGISNLAKRMGLAKSTVHRLATTLVEYDILEQNRDVLKQRPALALF